MLTCYSNLGVLGNYTREYLQHCKIWVYAYLRGKINSSGFFQDDPEQKANVGLRDDV